MKIGDIVRINDLCVLTHLHDTLGIVVTGPLYNTDTIPMMEVLIDCELIKFRQGDPQLEVVNVASR